MPYEFYFSIDAHQSGGATQYASALLEKNEDENGEADGTRYRVHVLKQYADAAPEDVVDDALEVITDDPFTGRTIFVANVADKAGRDVHAALRARGASPITVSVTGGDSSPEQGRPLSFAASGDEAVQVSEREIISTVEQIHRGGRLDLGLIKDDASSALVAGLEDYQVDADDEDGDPAGKRESARPGPRRASRHAGLVLAAGVASWLAEQHRFDPTEHLAGPPPPVREPKRAMRPDTAKPRTPQ